MTPFPVTASAIRQFAEALGDHTPRTVPPPTFAIVPVLRAVAEFVQRPEIGLDYERVVHRGQTFTHHRPIRVGDVLDTRTRLRDIRTIRGNVVARIDTDVDVAGDVICTGATTLVARGPDADSPAPRPSAPAGLGSVTASISRADVARYAEASGDRNPIHLDPVAAAGAGLPGVIAHGMLTMGIAMRILVDLLGDPAEVTACAAVFSSPVMVGAADVPLVVHVEMGSAEEVHLSVTADGRRAAQITVSVAHSPFPSREVRSM